MKTTTNDIYSKIARIKGLRWKSESEYKKL